MRTRTLAGLPLVVLAAGSVGLAGAGELEGQDPNRPEVVDLSFEGNQTFGDRALSGAILTRQTLCRSTVLFLFCRLDRDFALDRAYLNPRWLRDDYIRLHLFYRQRGYTQVQVDTVVNRPTDTTARVTFQIREGTPQRVGSLEFVGLEELEDGEALTRDLPIRVGDPLNRVVLEATRDTLTRRLRNQGYPHTDVLRNLDLPPPGEYDARVEFDVYTGPFARFGPIEVTGHEQVEARVVRRMLPFQEGSEYRQELLFDAQRNLFNLEIFRRARVIQDLEHVPDSVVPVRVEVVEGRAHRVRGGGGWNTAECFNAESRWSSRNFMGGARRLVLRGRLSNILTSNLEDSICRAAGTGVYGELNWLVSSDFTQPFLFSPRNTFSASIFMERQSLQDVFVRRAGGLNLVVTRTLGRATPLSFSYRPQRVRLSAAESFFCASFLVCSPEDIGLLQGSNFLSPVALSLSRDRTDRAFNPTRGYRFLADVEHASDATGSTFAYERAVAEVISFRELFGDAVLAFRVRGGWVGPRAFEELRGQEGVDSRVVHPQKRFFAGGANSVRGYAQNQLGPRVLTVLADSLVTDRGDEGPLCTPESVLDLSCDASPLDDGAFTVIPSGGSALLEGSVELRFPVWGDNMDGAAFMDFGQVWSTGRDVALGDLAFTPGFGVRYQTPVGPIRVDVGYRGIRPERLRVITSVGELSDETEPGQLAVLEPRVLYGDEDRFRRRLQFHLSIGHAF